MREEAVRLVRLGPLLGSWGRGLVRFAARKPLGALGGVIFSLAILIAITAPWIAPMDPNTIDPEERLQGPTLHHLMGTDTLGRDTFSRVIYGSRLSIYVGLAAVALGSISGGLIGVVSAYFRRADLFIQRFMDIIQAFPYLVLALVVVAVLGPSAENVIAAIAILSVPRTSRVVRSAAIALRERQFVEAAEAIGCGNARIIFRHIIPNVMAPYLIVATALVGTAIVAEASLSFLGLGVPPPTPSWGRSLNEAKDFMRVAPWMTIFPAVTLSAVVFSINFLGDALRDVWDPRLRGT